MRLLSVAHLALVFVFAIWSGSRVCGASVNEAAVGAVTLLPAFVVAEEREQPKWQYISHRDFEILTLASKRASIEFANQLALTMEILDSVIPSSVRLRQTTPAMFIFDPRDGVSLETTGGVRALASKEVAHLGGRAGWQVGGFRGHDQDSSIDFAVHPEQRMWRAASGIYTSLIKRAYPRPAAWLDGEVGMEGRARFLIVLHYSYPGGLPPLVALAELPRIIGRFEATRPAGPTIASEWQPAFETSQWLMKWALFAEGGRYRARFWDFYRRSAFDPVAGESLFQSCLGMSYAEALSRVAAFRDAEKLKGFRVEFPKSKQPVSPAKIRDATPAEIARITGESIRLWERMLAPVLKSQNSDLLRAAGRIFDRGLRDSLTPDPRLLASVGIFRAETRRDAEALPLLEEATHAGVVRPHAYLELARIRLATAKAAPGAEGELSAAQFTGVRELLQQGNAQSDQQEQYYELLVALWENAAGKPERAELTPLAACAKIFVHRADLTLRSARVHAGFGFGEAARVLCEGALPFAKEEKVRAELVALKDNLGSPASGSDRVATP